MRAYRWSDPVAAAWLSSLVPDVVDAVQSVEGELGDNWPLRCTVALGCIVAHWCHLELQGTFSSY